MCGRFADASKILHGHNIIGIKSIKHNADIIRHILAANDKCMKISKRTAYRITLMSPDDGDVISLF